MFNTCLHSATADPGSQSLVDQRRPTLVVTEISGDQRYSSCSVVSDGISKTERQRATIVQNAKTSHQSLLGGSVDKIGLYFKGVKTDAPVLIKTHVLVTTLQAFLRTIVSCQHLLQVFIPGFSGRVGASHKVY